MSILSCKHLESYLDVCLGVYMAIAKQATSTTYVRSVFEPRTGHTVSWLIRVSPFKLLPRHGKYSSSSLNLALSSDVDIQRNGECFANAHEGGFILRPANDALYRTPNRSFKLDSR